MKLVEKYGYFPKEDNENKKIEDLFSRISNKKIKKIFINFNSK